MIILKRALPRRTVLRGLGVAVALPLLDAMVPALTATAKSAAKPVRRTGFIYVPNGVAQNDIQNGVLTQTGVNHWRPKGDGPNLELSSILRPLESFRAWMVVLSGLGHDMALAMGDGNGDHSRASASFLSACHPKKTESADLRVGKTVDQVLVEHLGTETSVASLEVISAEADAPFGHCENNYTCTYLNSISYRTPSVPQPFENNPRNVFDRMFGHGRGPERLAALRKDRSILDQVRRSAADLQRTLGAGDGVRVSEYLDSLREVEQRIQNAEARSDGSAGVLALERPAGIPATFTEHASLMYDLLSLAYQSDTTRCFTFMLDREINGRTFPEIGLVENHHSVSHHVDRPEQIAKLLKINVLQAELFKGFLEKLRSLPDGDGTLFDHTLLMYGAGLSNPNEHSHFDLPVLLVGGQLKGGRHVVYPWRTPLANLYLSMFDAFGIEAESFGNSTGRLGMEPLAGI
jgi:hypothetical protein